LSYDKKTVVAVIFVILLVVVVLGMVTNYVVPFAIPSCGYEVLSLDKIDFLSNAEQFNKPAYRATIVQNSESECIVGRFDASEINSKLDSSDLQAQYGFWVELTPVYDRCVYPIDKYTYENLLSLKYGGSKYWEVTWDNLDGWSLEEAENIVNQWLTSNGCSLRYSRGIYGKNPYGRVIKFKAFCVKQDFVAYHGKLGEPEYNSKVKVTVASNSPEKLPVSRTFNFGENVHGMIGDDVYVSWSGYLSSPFECSTIRATDIGALFVSNKWKTIDDTKWDYYVANRYTYLDTCLSRFTDDDLFYNGESLYQGCVNAYNENLVNPVLYSEKELTHDWISTTQEIVGSDLYLYLDRPIKYNVFTLTIDADWLGVLHPVGKPKIVSYPRTITIKSGAGNVWYDFQIKNDADYPGTFAIWAECERPVYSGVTQSVSFGPRETKTISLPFSSASDTTITSQCVLHASSELEEVTAQFSAVTEPTPGQCTPGELTCSPDGYWIMRCSSTGYFENYKNCQYGCAIINGQAQCKSQPCDNQNDGICPPGCPDDPDCKNPIINFSGDIVLWVILGIIALFILSGFYKMYKEGRLSV